MTDTAVPRTQIQGPGTVVPAMPHIEETPLFDVAPFAIDGQRSDKLTVTMSGSFSFEIGDAQGEALFAKLELGHSIELRASGTVVSKAGRYAISKDGEETITGVAGIKIDNLYLPTPEELT